MMFNKKNEKKTLVTARQIAEKVNISYQLVNYYTNIGLFHVCANEGNRRLYDYKEIDKRIKRIRDLKRRGYPLRVIRDELIERGEG